MRVKDYADLFAQDGYWRYKRAEKKKLFTDKSMKTRDAVMRNWVVPLWGGRNPRRLTVRMIDHSMMGDVIRLHTGGFELRIANNNTSTAHFLKGVFKDGGLIEDNTNSFAIDRSVTGSQAVKFELGNGNETAPASLATLDCISY
jgi:hypothetical protein